MKGSSHALNAPWALGIEPISSREKQQFVGPAKTYPSAKAWAPLTYMWAPVHHGHRGLYWPPPSGDQECVFFGIHDEYKFAFDVVSTMSTARAIESLKGPKKEPIAFFSAFNDDQESEFEYGISLRRLSVIVKWRDDNDLRINSVIGKGFPPAVLWVFETCSEPWSILSLPPRGGDRNSMLRFTFEAIIGRIRSSWDVLLPKAAHHVRRLVRLPCPAWKTPWLSLWLSKNYLTGRLHLQSSRR